MITPRIRRRLVAGALAGSLALAATREGETLGCNPDYLPICGRSAYLAKFVNQAIVNPAVAAPIAVPVGLVPYVEWNEQNPTLCAQPTSHSLDLTVTCVPQTGGGPTVTFGPVNVPLQDARPTVPGNQPVAGGNLFPLVLPAGTLVPGTQYRCTITGRYLIDFGPSTKRGAGQIIGTGPTVFCTQPGAPADATQPLLFVRGVASASANPAGLVGWKTAQPGDQVEDTYIVANNHPTLPAFVQVKLDTTTVARTPLLGPGSTADSVYPVSTDTPNGDRYALRFHEDRRPGALIPRVDPLATTGAPTFVPIVLAPYETRTVRVVHASHGMCKDGSCDEAVADFVATWPGGGAAGVDLTATACIGSVLQVDTGAVPRNALCTITDSIRVTGNVDLRAGPNLFGGQFRFATFGYGDQLEPAILDDSRRHVGTTLVPLIGLAANEFPTQSSSFIRVDTGEDRILPTSDFNVVLFDLKPDRSGFFQHGQETHLTGLDLRGGTTGFQLVVPFFFRANTNSDLLVRGDARQEEVVYSVYEKVVNRLRLLRRGTVAQVTSDGEFGVFADYIRTLRAECSSPTSQRLEVYGASSVDPRVGESERHLADFFNVGNIAHELRFGGSGSATLAGDTNLEVPATTPLGTGVGMTIRSIDQLPVAPAPPSIQKVTATSANALVPVDFWLGLRVTPPPAIHLEPLDVATRLQLVYGFPAKDSLSWTFEIPVEATFDPLGTRLGVSFGGRTDVFTGNANRTWSQSLSQGANLVPKKAKKPKGEAVGLKVKVKRKAGPVPTQTAVVTYTVSRANLSGVLFDEGLRDETVSRKSVDVPVRVFLDGRCFEGTVTVEANAKAGKSLTARSSR